MAAVCKYSTTRLLLNFSISKCNNHAKVCNISKAYFTNSAKWKTNSFARSNYALIATSVGAGALVGAGYSLNKFTEPKTVPEITNIVEKGHVLLTDKPNVEISRQVS